MYDENEVTFSAKIVRFIVLYKSLITSTVNKQKYYYYYSTANGFSPGGRGTTIRQQTNNTQDNRQ
jgi:hypothetical protein